MKLKGSKGSFFQGKIKFLAHIVSGNGIECDPGKTKALFSWPGPSNVTEIQRFLGFRGYSRRFAADFARVAQPLYALLGDRSRQKSRGRRKESVSPQWVWGTDQEKLKVVAIL